MVDKTLAYLDYGKLLEIIFHFLSTPYNKEFYDCLTPLKNKTEIEKKQDRIEALLEIVKWDGKIPLDDIPDVEGILKRIAIRDAVLEVQDFILLGAFLRACGDVLAFLRKAYSKKDFVEETLQRMDPASSLLKRISKTVNPEGFIEDSASYELSKLRTELFTYRERIRKQLDKIMEREAIRSLVQDSYVAIRNNRYVIPMKPNFNEALQGIVHDYSHTLKTSFVEPLECVELNNTVNMLVNEEKDEERKVLEDLTDFARGHKDILIANLDALKELDIYHALALFSLEFACVRPQLTDSGFMEIKGALNPFIVLSKKSEAVPVDIVMSQEKQVLIISGPNAGGKTAALKTIGLLSLMANAGLFIPARETPIIPFFADIFALIGDEQDISMELSSFTAHMYAIKDLYNHAGGNELILIDEIGGNTEPQEAAALAMAVIDAFVEKGCRVAVTTHLNLIKAYGYTRPFAINASTSFDADTMKPLYRLTYGTAGYSNAINTAKNIDIPASIIEKSYSYLGKEEFMLNDLVASLREEKEQIEKERQELARFREDARKRLALIHDKRDEFVRSVEEKCAARLRDLEGEIEEIRKEVAGRDKTSVTKGKRRLQSLQEHYITSNPEIKEEIKVGDYVLIKSLGTKGRVVSFDRDKDMYEVAAGNASTRLKRFMIEKAKEEKIKAGSEKGRIDVDGIESAEVNLVGMRVEEALGKLDRFLDKAIVDGVSKVRIVHGIGTGRLMQAIGEHLLGAKFVQKLHRDERNSGVTIVEFA